MEKRFGVTLAIVLSLLLFPQFTIAGTGPKAVVKRFIDTYKGSKHQSVSRSANLWCEKYRKQKKVKYAQEAKQFKRKNRKIWDEFEWDTSKLKYKILKKTKKEAKIIVTGIIGLIVSDRLKANLLFREPLRFNATYFVLYENKKWKICGIE